MAVVALAGCACPGGAAQGEAHVLEISASAAPGHEPGRRLRVHGIARLGDAIDHRWRPPGLARGGGERWFHLVPVVDDTWAEHDAIPLWITTASDRADVASWQHALVAELARGPIDVEIVARAGLDPRQAATGWHAALEQLATDGALHTDPRAPIAMWPPP